MLRTVTVSLALALVTVPASAQIFQPGTQPVGQTGGIVTLIQASQPCRSCHAGLDDTDDYEPWESWRGALMASAGRDPVFRSALAIAEVDNADAADFCVRCHSPGAWLRGRSEVPDYDASQAVEADRPRFHPDDPTHPPSDDLDGVSCMVCHRATDPTDAQLFNTQLVLIDDPDGDTRLGPYSYTGDSPPHPTMMSSFISEGRFCGQCHDITSPLLMGHRQEASGVVDTGRRFAIERTFSEWRASAAATRGDTCQDCHMPEVDHPVRVGMGGSSFDMTRDHANRHDLMGAAAWQLRAIATTIPDLAPGIAVHLTDNADRIEQFMTTAASVEIMAHAMTGTAATATVRVTNHTGHKLPTGYPEGRRMWLEIDVLDDSGASVAGSARYDAATGMLEHDAQARTYEAQMGIRQTDGTVTPGFHFVLSDTLITDTRIPPEGFAPGATDDTLPLGRDYGDGAGGYHNYDQVDYTLGNLCGTGTLHLRARLRYQATTQEYIEYLRDHTPASQDPAMMGSNWGAVAYQAWSDHGGATPIEMASATVDLGAAPMPCPGPDSGVAPDAGMPTTDGGMAMDAGTSPPPPASNCGCSARGGASGWIALAVAAVWVARRRRR